MPQLIHTMDAKINGRRVRVRELIHSGGPLGVREIHTLWVDAAQERDGGWPAGTVVVRRMNGDPRRRKSFKIGWSGSVSGWQF